MEKKKVISRKNLPARLPLLSTLVLWLVLDKLQSPGWIWGVVGTVMALCWISAIIELCKQDDVDIFRNEKSA